MDERAAVQLNKFTVTRYAYQKIKYCTACGSYTVLDGDKCSACGSKDKLIVIDKMFDATYKMRCHIEILILASIYLIGIITAPDVLSIVTESAASLVLMMVLILLQRRFRNTERARIIEKYFERYYPQIFDGLKRDSDIASKRMEERKFKEAYEDFREIGVFIRNDPIRLCKLICLSNLVLRKDADLELETLMLSYFNPMLVNYIDDVLKLNRRLVTSNVIEYAIANEGKILNMENGRNILINITGAAVRSKNYVCRYTDFIMRYIKDMKEDRLQRLYIMLEQGHDMKLDGLYTAVSQLISTGCKETL